MHTIMGYKDIIGWNMSTVLDDAEAPFDVILRRLKVANGWTLAEMASLTGLPKRSIESYMREKDPQKPGLDALKRMAKGLNVSVDALVFGGSDEPEKDDYELMLSAWIVTKYYLDVFLHTEKHFPGTVLECDKIMMSSTEDMSLEIAKTIVKKYFDMKDSKVVLNPEITH